MEPGLPPSREAAFRPMLLVLLGMLVLALAAGLALHERNIDRTPARPADSGAAATPPATATATPPPAPATQAPSFDVVRVTPQGDAVMAGRAAPGSEVVIAEDGKEIGRAQANPQGEWVFVPSAPLPAGPRALTLTERTPGGQDLKGDGSVLLVVPEARTGQAQNGATPPLAVLSDRNAPPLVLQGPAAAPGTTADATRPSLGAVDYNEHGEIQLGGTARPGATVRVYVDGRPVGDARADATGNWNLSPTATVTPGMHQLRLDQLGADGQVVGRVELPFRREELPAQAVASGRLVVQPGQSLWLIARRTYGAGVRYTVVYQANRSQIRDPNLIYPGQVFRLPSLGPSAAAPPPAPPLASPAAPPMASSGPSALPPAAGAGMPASSNMSR